MSRIEGEGRLTSAGRLAIAGLLMAVATGAAGCSTDFRRLEQPSLAPGEPTPLPTATLSTRRNAGAPVGQESWTDSGPRAALPPITASPSPPPVASPSLPASAGLSKPFDRPKPATPVGSARAIPASGRTIDVQPGDTLYALAKRHSVSIADLMDANQLKSPALRPGQKLALPEAGSALRRPVAKSGTQVASASAALPSAAISAPVEKAGERPAAALAPAIAGEWTGTYVLKQGDSLYAVARNHKVSLSDLQRHNSIADPKRVRQGTTLKVPGAAGTSPSAPATAAAAPSVGGPASAPRAAQIAAAPMPPASAPVPSAGQVVTPKIINIQPIVPSESTEPAKGDVAPVLPTPPITSTQSPPAKTDIAAASQSAAAAPTATGDAPKFRWPVKGQILAGFGKRPDGAPNEGINIAVPAGTDVHAAGDGYVAYAGSELQGFGKLVLIRHDGGYVTAYAHSSELLVKRGDTVKRGQVIAKAGQSGGVDKPQVHFEVRKDSKPIDPAPHMEKM